MTDLVVVGGGLGGCLAALAATESHPSASVTLVAPSTDRAATESGLVDLLGYRPDGEGPVARPLDAIEELPDDHPYARLGRDTVGDALDLFDDAMTQTVQYVGDPAQNGLVGTPTGDLRPTARYPESAAAGLLSDDRPLHLVGFDELTHLDVEFVADRLDERVPYEVESTTLRFPIDPSGYPPVREFATALDENDQVSTHETADATDSAVPIRTALARDVREALDIAPRVGFPAILGIESARSVRETLESRLQADVFEVPFGRPSLPGLRRRNALFAHLESRGVTVEYVDDIVDVKTDGGCIDSLRFDDAGRADGASYVLATGDFVAGGLDSTHDTVTEPIFDCHVRSPGSTEEWADDAFLGDHPFARFGVDVSEEGRPVGPDGTPTYENLWAAGTILGGWDFTAQLARSGVELATGYDAGLRAIEQR